MDRSLLFSDDEAPSEQPFPSALELEGEERRKREVRREKTRIIASERTLRP